MLIRLGKGQNLSGLLFSPSKNVLFIFLVMFHNCNHFFLNEMCVPFIFDKHAALSTVLKGGLPRGWFYLHPSTCIRHLRDAAYDDQLYSKNAFIGPMNANSNVFI